MESAKKPIFISEAEVESVISWPLVTGAVEEALRSVCRAEPTGNLPFCNQPVRSFTFTEGREGVLLTMPAYVGNYSLEGRPRREKALACKVVTAFNKNERRQPPLPNILANILLFDTTTGKLNCVMEGTAITAMRTAAASIVATKHLYFSRPQLEVGNSCKLAILGCGVQGRIHAIGFCNTFERISEIRLWNKTLSKAQSLASELKLLRAQFANVNCRIVIYPTVEDCVNGADIIVTATFASEPFLFSNMLKPEVHINAIGAGVNHHSELSEELYLKSNVYVDNLGSARTELKELKAEIVGELGEVIEGIKPARGGITVFQSMGMAAEDATVAQEVYNVLQELKENK